MTSASQIPYWFLDRIWKPKWKKEALAVLKGGKKFLNYKRDLLTDDRISEIESRIKDLRAAIHSRDVPQVTEACKQLSGTCEHSLRSYKQPDAIAENIEVFFVAIAVALGIRAYYVQPFRIPTGSMQPTLNGIVGHQEKDPNWEKPNLLVQSWGKITEGRTYVKAVAPFSGRITAVEERRWMWFFTKTDIYIDQQKAVTVNGSQTAVLLGLGLGEKLGIVDSEGNATGTRRDLYVKKGDIIVQGWVDTGDLVLVDKISYRFRNPNRGEVFVFETRGIVRPDGTRLAEQNVGSHYIKRLAGVPGDKLQIREPNLYINDKLGKEKGFQRVMSGEGDYHGYTNIPQVVGKNRQNPSGFITALNTPGSSITLAKGPDQDQYFALGDNSANSSDSRYWGTIDEYLLVGPGLFTLWPFENFGFIR